MSVGEYHPPEEHCPVCGRYRAVQGYIGTLAVCCCSTYSTGEAKVIVPKYPGFQYITFNEAVVFAERVVRQMGIDRQALGIRDFDFNTMVAAVYHEMTRAEMSDGGEQQ